MLNKKYVVPVGWDESPAKAPTQLETDFFIIKKNKLLNSYKYRDVENIFFIILCEKSTAALP